MTDDEELEAMARAICLADKTAPDPDARILIGMKPAKAWEGRIEMARAAREALEEFRGASAHDE